LENIMADIPKDISPHRARLILGDMGVNPETAREGYFKGARTSASDTIAGVIEQRLNGRTTVEGDTDPSGVLTIATQGNGPSKSVAIKQVDLDGGYLHVTETNDRAGAPTDAASVAVNLANGTTEVIPNGNRRPPSQKILRETQALATSVASHFKPSGP
jgi:hypothetical protein